MKNKSPFLEKAAYRIKNKKWLRYSSNIARRILAAIEEKESMSQKKLALMLDVSPQYISKVVSGNENLTLETIAKISDALEVELISFPKYKDDMPISFFSLENHLYNIISGKEDNKNLFSTNITTELLRKKSSEVEMA